MAIWWHIIGSGTWHSAFSVRHSTHGSLDSWQLAAPHNWIRHRRSCGPGHKSRPAWNANFRCCLPHSCCLRQLHVVALYMCVFVCPTVCVCVCWGMEYHRQGIKVPGRKCSPAQLTRQQLRECISRSNNQTSLEQQMFAIKPRFSAKCVASAEQLHQQQRQRQRQQPLQQEQHEVRSCWNKKRFMFLAGCLSMRNKG